MNACIKWLPRNVCALIAGMCSSLVFAPTFIVPCLFMFAVLCAQIKQAVSLKQALILGYIFGFGHFFVGLYWISIGISVYIDEFWWAIPFASLGLPLLLAIIIAISTGISWYWRNNNHYQLIFCACWVFCEWIRSWILTGFPWNLLGYAVSFSVTAIQIANVIGTYGLSFILIYIATSVCHWLVRDYTNFIVAVITSIILLMTIIIYGIVRLHQNPTNFSPVIARLVQPSIIQTSKWDINKFWSDLNRHLELSTIPGNPNLIIWPEAALIVPYTHQFTKQLIIAMLSKHTNNPILITGGIKNDNLLYNTLYAIDSNGNVLFEYYKIHLVPFGEYVPLRNIWSFKKIAPGITDCAPGNNKIVHLQPLKLTIRAIICYESIFPEEVRSTNQEADIIINVTNDAWYGYSSGPYQHFYISRIRAVENGLPMIRVANNGISAVIDPLGRIVRKLNLNKIDIIDSPLPYKLTEPTLYSLFGYSIILPVIIIIQLILTMIKFLYTSGYK